ncbi:MAG: SDR family NAD(P)-dependent oxidoreductase [Mesorhizobium sp.]
MTGARHVVIAGGSRGIGAACASMFLAAGDRVTILSRSGGVDLSDPAAAEAAIRAAEAEKGRVEVLVCTAGAARQAPPTTLDVAALRAGMEAKYFTYVHAIMPALASMIAGGGGVIVNVIGMGGKFASPTHLPGGAANAALMLLTTGLANAWGHKGVRVHGLNPGPVATERFEQLVAARAAHEAVDLAVMRQRMASSIPSGKVPSAEEIAEIVTFLASGAAAPLSGSVISADSAATPLP